MMEVKEIVRRVRSAIDELMQNDSEFITLSEDELNLTDIIKDKIGYALRHVIESAPLEKLDASAFKTLGGSDGSFVIQNGVGLLTLPSDLLRIIEARLSSWSQFPIPESDTSQVAMMQQDQYARGSWDRPVNILTYDQSTGKKMLEMYCAKEASDTLKFVYVGVPAIPSSEQLTPTYGVAVPSRLEAAFIYQVAGLSMVAFRESVATSLLALSEKYLGNDPQLMLRE